MPSRRRISITNIKSIGESISSSSADAGAGAGACLNTVETAACTSFRSLSIASHCSSTSAVDAASAGRPSAHLVMLADTTVPCSAPQTQTLGLLSATEDLIERRAWDDLRRLLAEAGASAPEPARCSTSSSSSACTSIDSALPEPPPASEAMAPPCVLHAACRRHAPLDVVRSLHALRPSAASAAEIDADGRTALHHAAAAWNAPAVVKFLLRRDAAAASRPDADGRTPLHLCVHPDDVTPNGGRTLSSSVLANCPRSKSTYKGQEITPLVQIVILLCCAAPEATNADDADDCTPIEYALESDFPLLAVQAVRKASEAAWKDQKRRRQEAAMAAVASQSAAKTDDEAVGLPLPSQVRPEGPAPLDRKAPATNKTCICGWPRPEHIIRFVLLSLLRCYFMGSHDSHSHNSRQDVPNHQHSVSPLLSTNHSRPAGKLSDDAGGALPTTTKAVPGGELARRWRPDHHIRASRRRSFTNAYAA